jgi:hypothetical protein
MSSERSTGAHKITPSGPLQVFFENNIFLKKIMRSLLLEYSTQWGMIVSDLWLVYP